MVLRGRIEADHVEFEKTQEDSKTRLELVRMWSSSETAFSECV